MSDDLGYYEFPKDMETELLKVYRVRAALTENYTIFYAFVHSHRSSEGLPELSNHEMKSKFFDIVTQVGINNFRELPNKIQANPMHLARYGYGGR